MVLTLVIDGKKICQPVREILFATVCSLATFWRTMTRARGPQAVATDGALKAAAADLNRLRERCDRAKALCSVARGQILLGDQGAAVATLDRIATTLSLLRR